jgi:Uma2 family endonuclease
VTSRTRVSARPGWRAPDGPWTDRHLKGLSAEGHRYEIVDGSLLVTPPPGASHQQLVDELVAALCSAAPPGWLPAAGIRLRLADSYVTPDVSVLRPAARTDDGWADAIDVALVVEVESPHTRRHDRFLKPGLYAEADIESYWRIECTGQGPAAHLYTRASAGHYALHRCVNPGRVVLAELPYAVQVAPATWTTGPASIA